MSVCKYENYKDSNIEWIGKTPVHWDKHKISRLFDLIGSGTTPNSNNIEYFDGDIPWLLTGDLNDFYIQETSKKITQKAKRDYSALKIFPKDSLVMAMYGATIGKLGITKIPLATNQACCVMSNPIDKVCSKFIFFWLLGNRKSIISLSYGGGQPNISQATIKSLTVPLPPLEEQKNIVKFLEDKSDKIDVIVSMKKSQIEILQKYRQSFITETVTGGLNPKVKMRDSGVEWIGPIPEHWNVNKIKFSTYVKGRIGWQGLKSDEFIDEGPYLVTGTDFINGKVNWETCYHISERRYNEAPPIQLKEDDLLITKDGSIGKLAMVDGMPEKAILNSGIFVTRPLQGKYLSKYLYWILSSDIFKNFIDYFSTGSTIKHLYQETFVNFSYPFPKYGEQEEIVRYLDVKISEIDGIILAIEKQIQTLQLYRQSLIYEAVTGKIDVRNYKESDLEVKI